jgi:5'-phosphate synthase pdxT subunit
MVRVGILALQGTFKEHSQMFDILGVESVEIRLPNEVPNIDALVIPGGESTTMAKLMDAYQLRKPIQTFAAEGKPIWGTCAGLILMGTKIHENYPEPMGLIDLFAIRNAYGRQINSFQTALEIPILGTKRFQGIFIRAPVIKTFGEEVEILANLPDGSPVAAREQNRIVTSFHPELTSDTRFHSYFLSMVN